MKPLARTDRLIKQEVEQDTLVYDPADDTACCLNSLASLVWRNCDGNHTVEEIAHVVGADVELPFGVEPADAVREVLDELRAHNLLAEPGIFDKWAETVARRDVVKLLATLPLFPAIQSITAPISKSSASPPPAPSSTATPPAPPASSPAVSPSVSSTPALTPTMTPTMMPFPSPTPTTMPFPSPTPTPSGSM